MIIIILTYFKASGKYYSQGQLEVSNADRPWEIYEHVRQLLQTRNLPGLIPGHSNFTVHVHIPDGVPAVISEFEPPEDLSSDHQTMLALLDYPNAEGLDETTVRWRNFARAILRKPSHEALLATRVADSSQSEEFDDYERYEPYEDDAEQWVCLFPGNCCMPSLIHHQSECYTPKMAEEQMQEEMAKAA
jgi:hypothetical protein